MAIFSNLLPLSSVDIVRILNQEGEQIFVGDSPKSETFGFSVGTFLGGQLKAQPMKGFVRRDTKGFTHPLENNKNLTDHRIILPIIIDMKMLISKDKTSQIYKEFEYYFNTAAPVTVVTKAGTFDDMYVAAIPHSEAPDKFDSLEMDVRFDEIQLSANSAKTPSFFDPSNDDQSTTIGRGELTVLA
jgi:hypothetical protein